MRTSCRWRATHSSGEGEENGGVIQTVVIGAGQAGLSVGYLLARRGLPFVILEANERVGDSWRKRWDSLRLFTPARYDGIAGAPFPDRARAFPTKNEMADYLEAYAKRFELPVRTGVAVERLSRENGRYVVRAGNRRFEAEHVVVAMATYQKPRVPAFANELDPAMLQLHSWTTETRPSSSRAASSSWAPGTRGRKSRSKFIAPANLDVGKVRWPRPSGSIHWQALVDWRRWRCGSSSIGCSTVDTPLGRKARPAIISRGGPLIRIKPRT